MESPSTWHRLSALVRSLYNKEKGKSYAKDIVSYILVDDIFIDSRNIYVKEKYDMWTGLSPIGSNIGRAFFFVCTIWHNNISLIECKNNKGENYGTIRARTLPCHW